MPTVVFANVYVGEYAINSWPYRWNMKNGWIYRWNTCSMVEFPDGIYVKWLDFQMEYMLNGWISRWNIC